MCEMELAQHRAGVESLYDDACFIVERQKLKNPTTHQTEFTEVTVLENEPCRLSFKAITTTKPDGSVSSSSQEVKLFIAPEIDIKSGSKITVKHCGRELEFMRSGIPAIYLTHQEIMLTAWERWA